MKRSAKTHVARFAVSWFEMHRGLLLGVAILVASVLGIFHKALFTDQVFAFRDAAHFYYPLFQWISNQWELGQLPLWNPLEDLGWPVIADATSSVFYPGKLLFLLPGQFGFWYKTYIVAHVLLCALTSFRLARHWQIGTSAATLAALSYALSGNVLFQYCNVVYLVGAAWLPFAIQSGDRLLTSGGGGNRMRLAFGLAMMVLGGDAQSAYHTGMMLVGLAWMSRRTKPSGVFRSATKGTLQLVLAALLAIGLAAVQWLPSANWMGNSTRACYDAPRNLYEFVLGDHESDSNHHFRNTLFGRIQAGHHSQVFDFSVGPWRFIELLWPNVGGTMFPQNQRWMNAIPAEGRVWTPTLYMGLLPVLLASLAFRLRHSSVRRRFLSWCVVLSVFASLGAYGLGWLLAELHYQFGGEGKLAVGGPFGGLYWLMTVVLPGYVYFRYPAKLWVITSLAVSQLAAIAFDRGIQSNTRSNTYVKLQRQLSWILGGSLAIAALVWLAPIDGQDRLAGAPVDRLFGPLDVSAVRPQLMVALLSTCLLAITLWAVLTAAQRTSSPTQRTRNWQGWLFVLLTAVELVVAQHRLVPLAAPDALLEPRFSEINRQTVPVRFYRGLTSWYPKWSDAGSDDRLRQCLAWNNATFFPKYHLLQNLAVVGSRHSMQSARQTALFSAVLAATEARTLPVQFLRNLGVSYQITSLSGGAEPPPLEPGQWSDSAEIAGFVAEAVRVHFDAQRHPRRAWIVKQIEWAPPVDSGRLSALAAFSRHVVQPTPDAVWRDFQTSAIVESPTAPHVPELAFSENSPLSSNEANEEQVEITSYAEVEVQLTAQLTAPGLVVLNDTYAAGWNAYVTQLGSVTTRQVPIYRTNSIMRGIYLPSGRFDIQMRYKPNDFAIGATISAATWTICLLYLIVHFGLQFVRHFRSHA